MAYIYFFKSRHKEMMNIFRCKCLTTLHLHNLKCTKKNKMVMYVCCMSDQTMFH